jgi:hypothetical protein
VADAVIEARHAIMREALSQWLETHEHEAGLVHAPILRHQFRTAARRMAQDPQGVPIHRLRQTLQWPRANSANTSFPPVVT